MRQLFILALVLNMSACFAPAPPQQSYSFAHSGLDAVHSPLVVLAHGPHRVLRGRVQVLRQNQTVTQMIAVSQVWDGVHPRMRVDSVWWHGRALPFRKPKRGTRVCGPTGCQDMQIAYLFLDRDAFLQAAQTGYSARLLGRDGAALVHVPAPVIAATLAQARAAGLLPEPTGTARH